jgi:hypothetical protein
MTILFLRRTFSQAAYYYSLYVAAFAVALALAWFAATRGFDLRVLEVRDYSVRRCEIPTNPNGPVLRVLDAVYMEDVESVLETWCHAPEIARGFGALELRSVHRDHLDHRDLFEASYALVLAKPELMESGGPARKAGIGYELFAKYPEYGSQLVSLQGVPQLNLQWMKDKTLGLLDDPNSVSAYQIPLAALRVSGMENVPKIVYYRSYRQLYKALFEREVDMIPALLSEEGPDSALRLPKGLVLEQTLPGPAWYIHRDLLPGEDRCMLQRALQALALHASVSYFRDLRFVQPCDAQ